MHPNWRALATVDFPRKIFVKGSEEVVEKEEKRVWKVCATKTGTEAKEFYEEVVQSVEKEVNDVPKVRPERLKKKTHNKNKPFNKNLFFRAAVGNDTKTIFEMDFLEHIEAVDDYGWTALMMAACEGAEDTVQLLLEAGASATASDSHGNSVESLAKKKGHHNVVLAIQDVLHRSGSTEVDDEETVAARSPHFCELCNLEFRESSRKKHETSTLHRFNWKSSISFQQRFSIPNSNRGCKIMLKQGWNKRDGLGPTGSGRIFPVKTVIRRRGAGLGIPQSEPRITHESPNVIAPPRRERTRRDRQKQITREKSREIHFRQQLS